MEPRRFFDSAISDWVEYFPFDRFDRVHDFDISNLVLSPVFRGTSDRDNIPAIREPRFTPVAQVRFLNGDDVLMTVTVATEIRGYPLRIRGTCSGTVELLVLVGGLLSRYDHLVPGLMS